MLAELAGLAELEQSRLAEWLQADEIWAIWLRASSALSRIWRACTCSIALIAVFLFGTAVRSTVHACFARVGRGARPGIAGGSLSDEQSVFVRQASLRVIRLA